MRFYHLIFLVVVLLVGVVFSGTIRQYLTFLPQY